MPIKELLIPCGFGRRTGTEKDSDAWVQEEVETVLQSGSGHGVRLLGFNSQFHNLLPERSWAAYPIVLSISFLIGKIRTVMTLTKKAI